MLDRATRAGGCQQLRRTAADAVNGFSADNDVVIPPRKRNPLFRVKVVEQSLIMALPV